MPQKKVLERCHLKELIAGVDKRGGFTRRVTWQGRRHAPDLFIGFPHKRAVYWAETKPTKGNPTAGQAREHERLVSCGQCVVVLNSFEAIDSFFALVDSL